MRRRRTLALCLFFFSAVAALTLLALLAWGCSSILVTRTVSKIRDLDLAQTTLAIRRLAGEVQTFVQRLPGLMDFEVHAEVEKACGWVAANLTVAHFLKTLGFGANAVTTLLMTITSWLIMPVYLAFFLNMRPVGREVPAVSEVRRRGRTLRTRC